MVRDWEKANIEMNFTESLPLLKKLGEEFRKACEEFNKTSAALP